MTQDIEALTPSGGFGQQLATGGDMEVATPQGGVLAGLAAAPVTGLSVSVVDVVTGAEQVTVRIPMRVVVHDTDTVGEAVVVSTNALVVSVSDAAPAAEAVIVRIPMRINVFDAD